MEYTIEDLVSLVGRWAEDRNLILGSTPQKQKGKLLEEIKELFEDVDNGKDPTNELGDVLVVVVIIAMQLGISPRDALKSAYLKIRDRKGKMVDGVFVKESDLMSHEQ